jgi:GNAT superfamily N-acetyltransferase
MVGLGQTFMGSGGEFLLGHIKEKLVVMGGFKLLSESLAEIKRMRVAPSLQGQGIGYWFLDLLEDRIKNSGVFDINLSTTSKQEGALRLYAGAGYEETGREKIDRGHEKGLIVVSFTKSLHH